MIKHYTEDYKSSIEIYNQWVELGCKENYMEYLEKYYGKEYRHY